MSEEIETIVGLIFTILLIAGGVYYFNNRSINNPTLDVKTDTQIKVTTVQVGTFYDGKDGYSLSIPSGNSSTCIWTYVGGNASIPGSETTSARSATEKHTVYVYDLYDWKVSCVDDFGNQYTGVFPRK
jgi:hypothetical protein